MDLGFYVEGNDSDDDCLYCGCNRLVVLKKQNTDYSEQIKCCDCGKTMQRWKL